MKPFYLLGLISCFFATFLLAGEIRVAQTVPAAGAVNVSPGLEEIVIVFSAPVKQNSWSFVETEAGRFPETAGDPYFKDNRTCVLPVILEPETAYSLGINSAARKGFKSAADETVAVTPYLLTFSTGPAGSEEKTAPPHRESAAPQSKSAGVPETMIFQRANEPKEGAFSLLIPRGWQTEGGILRDDPTAQGGPSQSVAAKLDFSVKKDPQGSVMARWLPDILYFDSRMSPAGQMGLFPQGSNYMGMPVYYLMPAQQFLSQIVFPYAHPRASGVKILEQRSLPELSQKYRQRQKALIPQLDFSYDAAILTVSYQEDGVTFKEKLFTVIENWGQAGAGMWGNKETFFIRAPGNGFEQWEPVFSLMQNSVLINSQWLAGEIRGQMQRAGIVAQTMQEIQRIDREIVEHRQKTNAEIHNDMFLTLTDQEEYVNPYTNQVETGSNQWQYRWVNESGEVVYTNREDYNPNQDVNLNRSDYKKTPVRKRFPQ